MAIQFQGTQLPAQPTVLKQATPQAPAAPAFNGGLKKDTVAFGMGEQAAAEAVETVAREAPGMIRSTLSAIKNFFTHEDGLVRKVLSATWEFIKKLNPLNWFKSAEQVASKAEEAVEQVVAAAT